MRQSNRVRPLLVAFGILALAFAGRGSADQRATPPERRVVIAILGFVTWEDIARVRPPTLERLQREGAVGLVTRFSGVPPGLVASYLTLGSGAQVPRSGARLHSFRDTPPGPEVPEELRGSLVGQRFVRLASVQRATAGLHYDVPLGVLGQSFAEAGRRVAVIGNADIGLHELRARRREAAAIAMDPNGWVPYAAVGPETVSIRGGKTFTDRAGLLHAFRALYPVCSLLVVELGETSRAHYREESAEQRDAALRLADGHLAGVLALLDARDTRLFVVTPWADVGSDQPMAPILVWGAGVPPGWVTSASTHRPGMILSRDIAPSILTFAGLKVPAGLLGTPVRFEAARLRDPATYLASQARAAAAMRRGRTPAGIALSLVYGVAVILGTIVLFAGATDRLRRWPRSLLAVLILPAALALWLAVSPVMVPVTAPTSLRVALPLLLAAATCLPAGAGWVRFRTLLLLLSALSVLALAGDQVGPQFLAMHSPLGYSPVVGARFYGMGNELMSVFVASMLILVAVIWESVGDRRPHSYWALSGLVVAGLLLVGLPFLGANFGGTLTYGAGVWTIWVLLRRTHIRGRDALAIVVLTLLGTAVCVLADVSVASSAQTHLGRTAALVQQGGLGQLTQVVLRKAQANLHILLFVRWGAMFALLLPVVVYAVLKPVAVLAQMMQDRPALVACIKASVYAGIVGMLSNDSGIAVPCLIIGQVLPAAIALAAESGQQPLDLPSASPGSPRF